MSSEMTGLDAIDRGPVRAEAIRSGCVSIAAIFFCRYLLLISVAAAGCAFAQTASSTSNRVLAYEPAVSLALNFDLFAKYIGMFALFLLPVLGWRLTQAWNAKRQKLRPVGGRIATSTRSFSLAYEEQRKQFSRELHDSVGPILTAVGLQLRAIRSKPLSTEQLQTRLEEACRLNGEALRLVRDLAMGLRPTVPDDSGLHAALETRARQLFHESGIRTTLQIGPEIDDLPGDLRDCIYHCVLEALTNSAKHAKPTSIRILVHSQDDFVDVRVEDDGVGFDHSLSAPGLGLRSMSERVAELQGRLFILAQEQGGTAVRFEIPVPRGATV